jgi:photosystem II stability/assembly factor-like uncharacterized protein
MVGYPHHRKEPTLSKHSKKAAPRRVPLVLPVIVGFAIVAIAVGAILLSMSPGGQQTGSTGRPYVGGDLHSLAVDPTDPDKVVVGGHEGGAISSDGGQTWRQASGLEGADPMGWVIDPNDPSKMYVGGHPGFYRSEDGGKSFSQDNSGLPGTDVHGLGMDLQNPDTLYAYIVDEGIYRSLDAGESWEPVSSEAGVMGPILVDPRDSDTLYVSSMQGGFRKSTDAGESWETVSPLPGMVMSISQSWEDPDTFYAANGRQVLRSTDGGESWRPVGGELPGVSTVAVAPSDPRIVYAGVLEGDTATVYRSEDGGQTWRARN